jgi:hypothetical protein
MSRDCQGLLPYRGPQGEVMMPSGEGGLAIFHGLQAASSASLAIRTRLYPAMVISAQSRLRAIPF